MNIAEFKALLDAKGYKYREDEAGLTVLSGWVDLPSLTTLPEGVTFSNSGSVYLYSLTTLPAGATFSNGGSVDLRGLTTLPDGVTFSNGGAVYLRGLTTLPDGVTFSNGGGVYLYSLTTLPAGVTFTNGGGVDLRSMTTLPEVVTFNNSGWVDLRSLKTPQDYQGALRNFRTVDGITTIMGTSRVVDGYTIHSAKYMRGGPVDDLPGCYIAERDGKAAHGKTIKEAIEDVDFKLVDAADRYDVAAQVKDTGWITLAQFRALTGACRDGIRQYLAEQGIDLDGLSGMTMDDAIKASAGTSFGDALRGYVG